MPKIHEAICDPLPIVQICGIGGQGKSTLAYHVVSEIVEDRDSYGRAFDAVIWINVEDPQSILTVDDITTYVLKVFEYDGATISAQEQRIAIAEKLLRQNHVLIVIDHFDRRSGAELVRWIRTMPPNSKLIITSREVVSDIEGNSIVFHLGGLDDLEIQLFLQQLTDRLGIPEILANIEPVEELVRITGGNPKTLEIALGLVKKIRGTVDEVLDHISTTPSIVLSDLFDQAWSYSSPAGRSLLVSMFLLQPTTDDEPLTHVSGIDGLGELFTTLAELDDLSLIDVLREKDTETRLYSMHPLVSAYVASRLRYDESAMAIAAGCRSRWIQYAVNLSGRVGFCPGNIDRLEALDIPGRAEFIQRAIEWCESESRFEEAIEIARECRYYFYVRGIWDPNSSIHIVRARAARSIGDTKEEFAALTYHLNIAAKQENNIEIHKWLTRTEELAVTIDHGSAEYGEYRHMRALHLLAIGHYDDAAAIWEQILETVREDDAAQFSANLRWLAVAKGRDGKLEEAIRLLVQAREHAISNGFRRAEVAAELELVEFYFKIGDAEAADSYLKALKEKVRDLRDRFYDAQFAVLVSISLQRSSPDEAREYAEAALDLFEKLGLARGARGLELASDLLSNIAGG